MSKDAFIRELIRDILNLEVQVAKLKTSRNYWRLQAEGAIRKEPNGF